MKKWDLLLEDYSIVEKVKENMLIINFKYLRERFLLNEGCDFVVICHWFKRSVDNDFCVVFRSIDHPRCKVQPGYVRGKMICFGFLIMPICEEDEKIPKIETFGGDEEPQARSMVDVKKKGAEREKESILRCHVTQLVSVRLDNNSSLQNDECSTTQLITLRRLRNHIYSKTVGAVD